MPLNQKGFTLIDVVLGIVLVSGLIYGSATFWTAIASSIKQSRNSSDSTALTEEVRTVLMSERRCTDNLQGLSVAAGAVRPGPTSIQGFDRSGVPTGDIVRVGPDLQSINLRGQIALPNNEIIGELQLTFREPDGTAFVRMVSLWFDAPGGVIQNCKAGIDVDLLLQARACVISNKGNFKWDVELNQCVYAGTFTRIYGDDFEATCPVGLEGIQNYDLGCQPDYPAGTNFPEPAGAKREYPNGSTQVIGAAYSYCYLKSRNTCECLYRDVSSPPPAGTRVYIDCIPEGTQE